MGKKQNNKIIVFSEDLKENLEFLVSIIAQNYHKYKMIIIESKINAGGVSSQKLRTARMDKAKIDSVADSLSYYSKMIIDVDVILKDEGVSYLEKMSKSQYYRYRFTAYHEFITKLS